MILTYYCIITMIIIAYLLGSIPSAVWIGKKYYGIDIREHGSKNAGTTNVAGCCFPIFTIVSPKVNQSVPFIVFSFVTAVLLLYTHRKNIVRLKNGTESKIYIWKPHRREDKK